MSAAGVINRGSIDRGPCPRLQEPVLARRRPSVLEQGAYREAVSEANCYRFDTCALFRALDERREKTGSSWAQIAREIGVSASTLTRSRQGHQLETDGMRAMVRWLGKSPEEFVLGPKVLNGLVPKSLSSGSISRFDTVALYRALDAKRRIEGMTWRRVASAIGVSPGMLTRLAKRGRISADVVAKTVGWLDQPVEKFTYEADR